MIDIRKTGVKKHIVRGVLILLETQRVPKKIQEHMRCQPAMNNRGEEPQIIDHNAAPNLW